MSALGFEPLIFRSMLKLVIELGGPNKAAGFLSTLKLIFDERSTNKQFTNSVKVNINEPLSLSFFN